MEPDHAMACHDFRFERDFPQGGHIPLNYTRSFKISALVSAFRIYLHDRGLALFLGTVGGKLLRVLDLSTLRLSMFYLLCLSIYLYIHICIQYIHINMNIYL